MTLDMQESRFKGSAYRTLDALSNRSIELLWDRKQGQFTKGAVRVAAGAPAAASAGFAKAQPWDGRTYDEALNDPKKTVVDYFLLCPNIGVNSNGDFNVHDDIAPGREAFEDRKFPPARGVFYREPFAENRGCRHRQWLHRHQR